MRGILRWPRWCGQLRVRRATRPRKGAPPAEDESMLKVTRDLMLPTAITGSYPRPLWFDESLDGRSFKAALGDSMFREQYLDSVAAIINAQEAAGLDIV